MLIRRHIVRYTSLVDNRQMAKIEEVMPQTAMIDEGSFSSYDELLGNKELDKEVSNEIGVG